MKKDRVGLLWPHLALFHSWGGGSVSLVSLVSLVFLVSLVSLIFLVSLVSICSVCLSQSSVAVSIFSVLISRERGSSYTYIYISLCLSQSMCPLSLSRIVANVVVL